MPSPTIPRRSSMAIRGADSTPGATSPAPSPSMTCARAHTGGCRASHSNISKAARRTRRRWRASATPSASGGFFPGRWSMSARGHPNARSSARSRRCRSLSPQPGSTVSSGTRPTWRWRARRRRRSCRSSRAPCRTTASRPSPRPTGYATGSSSMSLVAILSGRPWSTARRQPGARPSCLPATARCSATVNGTRAPATPRCDPRSPRSSIQPVIPGGLPRRWDTGCPASSM